MEQVAFADTMHPLGRLNKPGNYDELTTKSVLDALPKFATWINDFIRWASKKFFDHEINPAQWLAEAIGGDWGDLLSIRDAWNNLSWASHDIGINLTRGLTELNPNWDGNAAQAFDAHMSKWNLAITQNELVCARLRDTLSGLARVGKEFLQAAIDVVEMLLALLGGGLLRAVLKAFKIADTVIKMVQVGGRIKKVVDAGVSVGQMVVAGNSVEAPETRVDVPEVPYGGPQAPGTM